MADGESCGWDPVCYMAAIGGGAKDAVDEVYTDASEAAGYVTTTIGDILKAPGQALKKIGEGVEKVGEGVGKGAAETPGLIKEGFDDMGKVLLLAALGVGAFVLWQKK